MKERLTARKVLHLVLVLALLLALMAYRTWFSADNSVSADQKKDQICDLSHTPCSALIGDKPLTVAIKELPLRAEHDFAIAITGGDPAIKPVKATLEGKDMFMGTIPVNFEQFEQIDGQWQGVTQVGSCTSPVMVWLLNIEWSNGQRQQLALSVARE
ncbi:hypothetical protein BJP22_17260 [Aeromonas veronii]|uniref:hypothetical protein n=1 Tax=Aeromonas veronii TaxID=654 RepID=UPI0005AA7415|nr:hypothetical protein [Aeromonas veronii]OKP37477.1 hypothetical protein BJP22_17260 [Aeromonas veronii]